MCAVRGECERLHRAFVLRQRGRLPPAVRHPVDLLDRALATARQERHPGAVRGPAGTRFPVLAVGQPDIATPVGGDPMDVGGPAVLLPVGVGTGVEQLAPVRGEARTADRGNVDQFHDGHRPLFLRRRGDCQRQQGAGSKGLGNHGMAHDAPPDESALRIKDSRRSRPRWVRVPIWRSAFQAVGAIQIHGGTPFRGAERRGCRSGDRRSNTGAVSHS